jgi:uncharacterized protein (TIGR02246 family)
MSTEDRLARLETAEDVRRLFAAYARACDTRDADAAGAIMHDDVELTVPDFSWRGRQAVVGFFGDAWSGVTTPQRHFITNIALDRLEPDSAAATAYFLHVTADGDRSLLGWGSYRDTFTRRDGVLLVQTKHIEMDLQVDLAEGWATTLTARAQ